MGCGSTAPLGAQAVAPAEGVEILHMERDDDTIELVRLAPVQQLPAWLLSSAPLEIHP